jgi:hypothetical protein
MLMPNGRIVARIAVPLAVAAIVVAVLAFPRAWRRSSTVAADPARHWLKAPPPRPYMMFISVLSDETFQHVLLAPLDSPASAAYVTPLTCRRVHFAGQRGICLTMVGEDDIATFHASVFDESFRITHRFNVSGDPSRVRVSPSGQRAGATVFESGHAYNEHGFSTRTVVYDLESGTAIGDLEDFTVWKDGQRIHAQDFNFWGLTFARNDNTFFATLDTGGKNYLVRGDVDRREIRVIRAGVECPSLSPDNTRLVFKKRIGSRTDGWWQLTLLELSTMTETPLIRETRSVDDQVEWLDDDRVIYHLTAGNTAADMWVLAVDGSAPPRQLITGAFSPAVVR